MTTQRKIYQIPLLRVISLETEGDMLSASNGETPQEDAKSGMHASSWKEGNNGWLNTNSYQGSGIWK